MSLFADTAYWIAMVNPADEYHEKAEELTASREDRLITTEWVLAEFLDGYCGSTTRTRAARFVRAMSRYESLTIVPATADWFNKGLERFERRVDKDWSLSDCISFRVMEKLRIREALTADHHFEQAGFEILLK